MTQIEARNAVNRLKMKLVQLLYDTESIEQLKQKPKGRRTVKKSS